MTVGDRYYSRVHCQQLRRMSATRKYYSNCLHPGFPWTTKTLVRALYLAFSLHHLGCSALHFLVPHCLWSLSLSDWTRHSERLASYVSSWLIAKAASCIGLKTSVCLGLAWSNQTLSTLTFVWRFRRQYFAACKAANRSRRLGAAFACLPPLQRLCCPV